MARACRFQSHLGRFRTVFLALLLIACALGTARAATNAEHLYLMAGTSTNHARATYPVSLYVVGAREKLRLVRRVVPPHSGLSLVREDLAGRIYVAYPHINATAVSVIHERRPEFDDEVAFNPKNLTVWLGGTGASAGKGIQSYALFPLIEAKPKPHDGPLVSVMGTAPSGAPRVEEGNLSDYESFRYAGCAGTPEGDPQPIARVLADRIVMNWDRKHIEMDTTPSSLGIETNGRPAAIIAATNRFFVFGLQHARSDRSAPTLMYVHDRSRNLWKEISFSASAPCSRAFGSWLATTVWIAKVPPREDKNPGQDDERNSWVPSVLPNVRFQFGTGVGYIFYIPGVLILDNLVDGRRVTLRTNKEDSQILAVRRDGLVLYRIDDEIFSAHIEGDKLSAPTLVVKGEDVPEVHWVFWSKARTEPHSNAHISSKH